MPSNRLAGEKSPYLLQHAHNPVDWMPWGEAAFQKARAEGKPIFLSVGYSTCHWCHVMERESFEDEATAALMNENFVNIKVDREERPDVDRLYMNFVQLATRSGGWPMSVFLTPDLKPFYGGTYFPPVDAWGRPGFPTLLRSIAKAWSEDRENVLKSADSSLHALQRVVDLGAGLQEDGSGEGGDATPWQGINETAFSQFASSYDQEWGGFGGAPKFPRPVQHDFLHAFYALTGYESARQMSEHTLRMLVDRGMNDQLGGGFHRYSVDPFWIVSHFEKMLYDQAQLTVSLLEMYQMSGDNYFAEAADKTLRYVWRDMTHLDGGFFAAEDADSLARFGADHKEEGAFYVWRKSEIEAVLGQPNARIFGDFYGVADGGNAPREGDPHKEFRGKNILFEAESAPVVGKMNGLSVREVGQTLADSREALFEARQSRPRPHRDEKVIVAWNGLMISAFARAGVVLDKPKWTRIAEGAARFVLTELSEGNNLYRHFKDGRAEVPAFADDYAAFARACLDLYDATFDIFWLQTAENFANRMAQLFYDEENGGFFASAPDPNVLVRFKEDYDGAEPSASALAVEVGARLYHLLGREEWRERAQRTCAAFAERLSAIPSAMPLLLRGKMLLDAPPQHVVLVGPQADALELAKAAREGFAPFRTIFWLGDENAKIRDFFAQSQPFLAAMDAIEGKAAAYICQNFACQRPVTTPAGVHQLMLHG